MRVIWYIYGDIFAHHPNLTIGTAVNGNLTPIEWNKPTSVGSYPNATENSPIGMTDDTPEWSGRRVIDFGDNSSWSSTSPMDVYIGDVDNSLPSSTNIRLLLYSNEYEPLGPLALDYNNDAGTHWFSSNASHSWYSSSYRNSDPALYLSETMRSTAGWINDYGANSSASWVIYKMRIMSSVSTSSSVFISNTTGVGQTIQQRFPGAVEYDQNNSDHTTAGTISDQHTTSEHTRGPIGFITNGTDIGQNYVAGMFVNDCPQGYNAVGKWSQIYNVPLDKLHGENLGTTLTGFKSENWTDYMAYLDTRPDLITYRNNGLSYNLPAGTNNQSCDNLGPATNTQDVSIDTFAIIHAETAGFTLENRTRPYGGDLNQIIPNPTSPGAPQQAYPPGSQVPGMCQDTVRSAFFDSETHLLIFYDSVGLSFWMNEEPSNINRQLNQVREYLKNTLWNGDQDLANRMMHVIKQTATKTSPTLVRSDRELAYMKIAKEANAQFYDPQAPEPPDQKLAIIFLQNTAFKRFTSRDHGPYHTVEFVRDRKNPDPTRLEEAIYQSDTSASTMHQRCKEHKRAFTMAHNLRGAGADNVHYLMIGPQARNMFRGAPNTTTQVFKQHLYYMYNSFHHCEKSFYPTHRDTYRDPSGSWWGRLQDYNFSYCVGDPFYFDTAITTTNRDAFRDDRLYHSILSWIGFPDNS